VGATGTDEYFLDPESESGHPGVYEAEFRSKRNGELFLYVNDAVIALPYLYPAFYWNNHGAAKVSVRSK
jgi:hypothetical protein